MMWGRALHVTVEVSFVLRLNFVAKSVDSKRKFEQCRHYFVQLKKTPQEVQHYLFTYCNTSWFLRTGHKKGLCVPVHYAYCH